MTNHKWNISAVIPAFNAETYIGTALKSLLDQSYPLHEIMIVDDGSTDRTKHVVKDIKESSQIEIRLISLSSNQGVSNARNLGVRQAKGDWILFLDADDIAEKDLLEQEIQCLNNMQSAEGKNWVLIHPAYEQIDESGNTLGVMRSRQVQPDEIFGYEIVRNDIISPSGVVVNKEAFFKQGGFNEQIRYSEDWDLWLRLARFGGFAYVDHPLIRLRRHPGNTSKRMDDMLKAERTILASYHLSELQEAIHKRHLPFSKNAADHVSLLFRLEHWDEGFQTIQEMSGQSQSAGLLFLQGLYGIKKKNYATAKDSFKRVIEMDAKNGAGLNNLAVLYALDDHVSEACVMLEQALSLHPGYLDAAYNLHVLKCTRDNSVEKFKFTWRELRKNLLKYEE